MNKSNLVGLIVSSALSFNSLDSLASDTLDALERKPKKIESIVRESVKFISSLEEKDNQKVWNYVNEEGDLISYKTSGGIAPVRSYKIQGFNIIGRCECAPVAFIAEEYRIKQKDGLFQVIDLRNRIIAQGEYLIKKGNKIYATTGKKTTEIELK